MYSCIKNCRYRRGKNPDIILLKPQVRFLFQETEKRFQKKPVMQIEQEDYGMLDSERVLKKP
ncbi:MAG: hypothetical protein ACLRIM_02435 [Clostridium sp.]